MDKGSAQGKKVAFWAIGLDCCEERSDFKCGDGADAEHQGGVRAPPDSWMDKETGMFMKAARLAAAVHDLKIDEEVILLHWVSDPSGAQARAILTVFGIDILGAGLFELLVLVLAVLALRHETALDAQEQRMQMG